MENDILVNADLLERFMVDAFIKIGIPAEDAKICANVVIAGDMRGVESHGISRFKTFYYDRILKGIQSPVSSIGIVKETPTTATIDGHNGMGQVIAKKSMQIAIKKAKKYGMGMVAVRNSTHFGIAGYYAMLAAEKNMIGICGTNARPSVAPTFGVENMLGTNPLTFAMPTDEEFPFVMDAATSLSQRGNVEAYERKHKKLPKGWVIDHSGKTSTDPQAALFGLSKGTMALTTSGGIGEESGGHKGYGYATVVEILTAALSGGSYLKMLSGIKDGKEVPIPVSHFFMAVDIAGFIDPAEFKKLSGDILRTLRASKKMPGHDRIYTAGEKAYEKIRERKEKGIPLSKATQKDLLAIQKETGLTKYRFPFGL